MNPSKNAAPYLLLSAACFALTAWVVYDFFAASPKPDAAVSTDILSGYDVSGFADSALGVEIAAPPADFAVNLNSPFRQFGAAPVGGSAGRAAPRPPPEPRRPRLSLKGLMKNPPLAILEDARGETHIKAQGDYIMNAQITAIEDNRVLLKDSSGTFTLTVEESR